MMLLLQCLLSWGTCTCAASKFGEWPLHLGKVVHPRVPDAVKEEVSIHFWIAGNCCARGDGCGGGGGLVSSMACVIYSQTTQPCVHTRYCPSSVMYSRIWKPATSSARTALHDPASTHITTAQLRPLLQTMPFQSGVPWCLACNHTTNCFSWCGAPRPSKACCPCRANHTSS